jgi:Tat protein secretion system quality control protein TatD with DNase activity
LISQSRGLGDVYKRQAKVGEYIATLKGLPIDELAASTSDNFFKCFQIDRQYK